MMGVYVVMGVSGCGKTTVGQGLAEALNCPFYDGDDFHPPENVAKMAQGTPLNDDDRYPWLAILHDLMANHSKKGETAVLACSALKKKYREQLRQGNESLQFIFLQGDFDLIWGRMATRQGHYMKADMLRSQFATLEEPASDKAHIVMIDKSLKHILEEILQFAHN